jgi:hypothetical protein
MKFYTSIREWEQNGLKFEIRRVLGHYCGYVRLPVYLDHDDRETIDVYGGITYAKDHGDGTYTYGFDCMNAPEAKTKDIEWVAAECERMGANIMAHSKRT